MQADEDQIEDMEAIQRYNAGDGDAMGILVRRHGRAVYSFIYRFLGNEPNIDDVYQDVWMRVIKSVGRFQGNSRFTTWLFQITRNICIDHLRKKKRRSRPLSLDEPAGNDAEGPYKDYVEAKGPSVDEIAANREFNDHLEEAVKQLPDDQREVFLFRRNSDLTFEEIADMSGVPRNTVKSRMRYALENIRRFLRKRVGREVMTNGN